MARVGLLVCDDLHEGLPAGLPDYPTLMARLVGPGHSTRVFRCHDGDRPEAADMDAWVIGGSRASAYDDVDWIRRLETHVRQSVDAGQPVVGLCFGHQVIHRALGGTVEPAAAWGLGAYPVTLYRDGPAGPRGRVLRVDAVHQDQVTTPASGLDTLAGSDFCPYYLSRGGPVLSIQAHPEFERPFYQAVLDRARDRVGAATVEAARRALPAEDDTAAVRDWIRAHLAGAGTDRRG